MLQQCSHFHKIRPTPFKYYYHAHTILPPLLKAMLQHGLKDYTLDFEYFIISFLCAIKCYLGCHHRCPISVHIHIVLVAPSCYKPSTSTTSIQIYIIPCLLCLIDVGQIWDEYQWKIKNKHCKNSCHSSIWDSCPWLWKGAQRSNPPFMNNQTFNWCTSISFIDESLPKKIDSTSNRWKHLLWVKYWTIQHLPPFTNQIVLYQYKFTSLFLHV